MKTNPNIPPSQSKIVPPYIPQPKQSERTIPLRIADLAVAACEAEIQKLREENARLKAEKDQAECDHDNCQRRKVSIDNHRFDLFTENKNLKAEVERLRKAGDAMDDCISTLRHGRHSEAVTKAGGFIVCHGWRMAKSGKETPPHA